MLHPRNRHQGRYELEALVRRRPELAKFLVPTPTGETSVDFSQPEAVRLLNGALLAEHYGVPHWDVPPPYLCPPIPGRVEYIHHLADLIGTPPARTASILDIGTGASCIYAILGVREYGWRFVGADIDPSAIQLASQIVRANACLRGRIELRGQASPEQIFRGVIQEGEYFQASICNPPFHASPDEARSSRERKWAGLGISSHEALNFGGHAAELWCAGGEIGFIQGMIRESAQFAKQVGWFTTLVSKAENLAPIERALAAVKVREQRTIDMAHGQKKTRLVAWTFGAG